MTSAALPIPDGEDCRETPAGYFRREIPGSPVTIELNPELVERLESAVVEAFRSITLKGLEIGGILLGRRDARFSTVTVEDFQAIPCEYARGPLYLLSDAERQRLGEALAEPHGALKPVGYFRSSARAVLVPDENDASLLNAFFRFPNCVVLLVKPLSTEPPAGALFVRSGAGLEHGEPFVFRASELREQRSARGADEAAAAAQEPVAEAPVEDAPAASAPEAAAPAVSVTEVAAPAEPVPSQWQPPAREPEPPAIAAPVFLATVRQSRGRHWKAIAAMTAILACGGALWMWQARSQDQPVRVAPRSALGLAVRRQGDHLVVTWDRGAPAIAKARQGVLSVSEYSRTENVVLDPDQLRNGALFYTPGASDITFRLSVAGAEGRDEVAESVRVIDSSFPAVTRPSAPAIAR